MTRVRRGRAPACVAATLVLALAAPGLPDGGQGERFPRLDDPRAELQRARAAKRRIRGTEGVVRSALRRRAAEAYRAVRRHHPAERAVAAEAAFRAGELLRADGRAAEALAEFEWARDHGAGTEFRARGGLEIGHVHRREERHERALDAYLAVVLDSSGAARHRDEASLWAGRAWVELGRPEDARRVWERVAGGAADPVQRVLAFDALALLRLEEGDLEACAGELERCRRAVADEALEETEQGERVRGALARMRALDALRGAIAARAGG